PTCHRPHRRRNTRITSPQVGSLYDIMYDNAGISLYVLPICWTDTHSKLLGARFTELPAIEKPVPDYVPGRCLEPSRVARMLTAELHTLVRHETRPTDAFCKNRAIKHVMQTLFPNTLSRPKTGADLDLYFGMRVFRKAVRLPCLWRSPGVETSFDSAPTIPSTSFGMLSQDATSEYAPNQPLLAYINRSQLAMIRQNLFRVFNGPDNTPNEPVARLQRLRSKQLIPKDLEHDPYFVGILLAMAQAHFYYIGSSKLSSRSSSRSRGSNSRRAARMSVPRFHDVKVRIITHDDGNDSSPNFVVYSATVTATFLERFLHPHKSPLSTEDLAGGGLDITYTSVPFWPILGLKERLAKALGREIAGDPLFGDPDLIALWDALVDQQPTPLFPPVSLKRRRGPQREALSEVLNSSFEDEIPTSTNSSEDSPVLSPGTKRRKGARSVSSTLEVC
ncbi:hypothetical protein B0T17DRAFT_457381, partial [Bombardia bombarda]